VLIRLLSFEYAKAQLHQLWHCGLEGRHLGLASGRQALINSFDVWVRLNAMKPNITGADEQMRCQRADTAEDA